MTYPGGKNGSGVYQTIINQIPPHRVYIEPFLGSGAIMRLKRPALESIGIDLSPAAIDGFGCVVEGLALLCTDGIDYLGSREFAPDEFIYCDPPYPIDSRRQHRRIYQYELDQSDHRRLLSTIKTLSAMVAISSYHSGLYDSELKEWRMIEFETTTRGGAKATECLWMNYPQPIELHDYSYLGSDFTERQRIKRKIARWRGKLERMPLLERQALMAAIVTCPGVAQPGRSP